jgi:hypothetical protein
MKGEYVLHTFTMSDVEDPGLYVAAPIYEWQQTEAGKTAMKYAENPKYYIRPDDYSMGYKVTITGRLEGKYATLYALKQS